MQEKVGAQNAPFVLDDRTLARRLDAFRSYCQLMPFEQGNWSEVWLGKAGMTGDPGQLAWGFLRDSLVRLYESPDTANGDLSPELAFLLAVQGLLETPREMLNSFPARYRDLYYRDLLSLGERAAQPDSVPVQFILADGVAELELPAGLLLDAGQDSQGVPVRYALDQTLTANQSRITDMRWVVQDPTRRSGRRARVVWDEANDLHWPESGGRLFAAAPVVSGARADADRDVYPGRVLGSPLFAVEGGKREWTITFKDVPNTKTVLAAISMGDRWLGLPCLLNAKQCTVTLAADGGAPAPAAQLDGLSAETPLLRLTSADGQDLPAITGLTLKVTGATGVRCVTDGGVDVSGGGLPFGDAAESGSGLSLAAPALWRLGQKLTQVTVTPAWQGLPAMSFSQWYGPDPAQKSSGWFQLDKSGNVVSSGGAVQKVSPDLGYNIDITNNEVFKAKLEVMAGLEKIQSAESASALFIKNDNTAPQANTLVWSLSRFPGATQDETQTDSDNPLDWPWRLGIALEKSFGAAEYAAHLAAPPQVIAYEVDSGIQQQTLKTDTDGKVQVEGNFPKLVTTTIKQTIPVIVPKANWRPPYLPQWSGLQVDFTAADTQFTQQIIEPFGYAEQEDGAVAEADLYIGLDAIQARQLLSLYWQFAQPVPLQVDWQYLAYGDCWQGLGSALLDDTAGFARSGGWQFEWPADATREARRLPGGRYWLRGRVTTKSQAYTKQDQAAGLPQYGWLVGLVSNVGLASLQAPQTLDPAHFAGPLPPYVITAAIDAPDGLQEPRQPWPSQGGRARETAAEFEARVARRLRHRERALNNADIATLLQEHDPGLWSLAMLPASRVNDGSLKQTAALMPRLGDGADPLRPAYRSLHLAELTAWLKERASPWLQIDCVNPQYRVIPLSWDIGYAPGVSRAQGDARVKEALESAFLPWLRDNAEPAPGVIGQPITHGRVREVMRGVPEVVVVKKIWLNGDSEQDPTIADGEVAVLRCVRLEYQGISVAWYGADNASTQRWGEAAITCEQVPVWLEVTLPAEIVGVSGSAIKSVATMVSLVDCDSGEALPSADKSSGIYLSASPQSNVPKPGKGSVYGDERVPSQSTVKVYFPIKAGKDACGVYRIGAAIKAGNVTLFSAQAQQWAQLSVCPQGVKSS